jgi:hypothetical protein
LRLGPHDNVTVAGASWTFLARIVRPRKGASPIAVRDAFAFGCLGAAVTRADREHDCVGPGRVLRTVDGCRPSIARSESAA